MAMASSRSNDSVPRPIHSGRYGVTNGITPSNKRIGAKPSSTLVTMWMASTTSTSSETSRWMESIAKRGQRGAANRTAPRIPITTLAVSSTSDTAPVPRARYQYALGLSVAAKPETHTLAPAAGIEVAGKVIAGRPASRRRGAPSRPRPPTGSAARAP